MSMWALRLRLWGTNLSYHSRIRCGQCGMASKSFQITIRVWVFSTEMRMAFIVHTSTLDH